MDIRRLLRLARNRWPEPEGKSHHVTLNNPTYAPPGFPEEDWLTVGFWVNDQCWYFHIRNEDAHEESYLDAVATLIPGGEDPYDV